MINLVDQSLEALLRAEVPLPANQIDVSFDPPDTDWAARTTKPTVNVFLWDVRRNLKERESGVEMWTDENGHRRRAAPKPRVDLRYLVTAWTADARDEHQLLGAMLGMLHQHAEFPVEYLHKDYAKVRPVPALTVAVPDGDDNADFWNALGGRLKPGLDLVVTATLDVALAHEVGPPVFRYEIELEDALEAELRSQAVLIGNPDTRDITRLDEARTDAAHDDAKKAKR